MGTVSQPEEGEGTLPPWMKMDWGPKVEHNIYRDWGIYYNRLMRESQTLHYLGKACELGENDWPTLYKLSLARSKAADIDWALLDAINAEEMARNDTGANGPINLQICDYMFCLNQFEKSCYTLHQHTRCFKGLMVKNFEKLVSVVSDTIKDTTGDALSPFYRDYFKLVQKVSAINKEKERIDTRPMWKQLKDLGKCDVLSIPEEEEENLSQLELARRKLAYNVINQTYLNNSWIDVLFMKQLRRNPDLLLDYCKNSREYLDNLTTKRYSIIRRFIRMIHSRTPLYYINYLKFTNKKMLEKHKEANLNRIQYKTHRRMIRDLRHIKELRQSGAVKELSSFIEKIMGDYYVIKTKRVMCWRFEFYNEVYNSLALALVGQYQLPHKYKRLPPLRKLLLLNSDKIVDAPVFVFGDRSTYQDGDVQSPAMLKRRELVARLESRIRFARYSIEKCYLYHQIGNSLLAQVRYGECCFSARKAIKESQNCNSLIWKFLSILLIIKANVMQNKIENTLEAIQEAIPVATQLKSPELVKFLETCHSLTDLDMQKKLVSLSRFSVMVPTIDVEDND